MSLFLFLLPKLLLVMGAVVGAYPSMAASRLQIILEQVPHSGEADLVLDRLIGIVRDKITFKRDEAANNPLFIGLGLSLTVMGLILETTIQLILIKV